jgi:hypothetical protein
VGGVIVMLIDPIDPSAVRDASSAVEGRGGQPDVVRLARFALP